MKWHWWIPLLGVFFVESFAEYLFLMDAEEESTKYSFIFFLWLLEHIMTIVVFAFFI